MIKNLFTPRHVYVENFFYLNKAKCSKVICEFFLSYFCGKATDKNLLGLSSKIIEQRGKME